MNEEEMIRVAQCGGMILIGAFILFAMESFILKGIGTAFMIGGYLYGKKLGLWQMLREELGV